MTIFDDPISRILLLLFLLAALIELLKWRAKGDDDER